MFFFIGFATATLLWLLTKMWPARPRNPYADFLQHLKTVGEAQAGVLLLNAAKDAGFNAMVRETQNPNSYDFDDEFDYTTHIDGVIKHYKRLSRADKSDFLREIIEGANDRIDLAIRHLSNGEKHSVERDFDPGERIFTDFKNDWRILYDGANKKPAERDITPRALYRQPDNDMYIDAHCHKADAKRWFKTDRILSITDLGSGEIIDNPQKFLDDLLNRQAATPASEAWKGIV